MEKVYVVLETIRKEHYVDASTKVYANRDDARAYFQELVDRFNRDYDTGYHRSYSSTDGFFNAISGIDNQDVLEYHVHVLEQEIL